MASNSHALDLKEKQLVEKLAKDKELRTENSKYQDIDKYVGKVAMIPTCDIEISDNCRSTVDTLNTQFKQLRLSIRDKGILQNLVLEVRKNSSGQIKFACISGQRRLLIARELGLEKVPCLITCANNSIETLSNSLDENILRENLLPIDIAESYYKLFTQGWAIEKISERYEKDSRTIQYFINIAKFPHEAKNLIKTNQSLFSTRVLFNQFAKKKWNSTATLTAALKEFINNSQNNTPKSTKGFENIKSDYEKKTGLKIKMKKNKEQKSVTLSFSYKTEAELNLLLSKL